MKDYSLKRAAVLATREGSLFSSTRGHHSRRPGVGKVLLYCFLLFVIPVFCRCHFLTHPPNADQRYGTQEKELEEMTEAYNLALEYTPAEMITDGSESYSINASSTRRDDPLLLKDDENRQQPLAITDGKQVDDVQAENAAVVAPEMNHVTVSANGVMPGNFDAAASARSGPSTFPDARWAENPPDMPSASSMAVVGGYGEIEGEDYLDVEGPSGKIELNGNGHHDPAFGAHFGGAEIFDPSPGSSGRENGSNPGGRLGAGALTEHDVGTEHNPTNSRPHEREVLFEPPTETRVGGNGSGGQYPWDAQTGNGSVDVGGTESQEEVGRAAGQDVSSFDTSPAISTHGIESATDKVSEHRASCIA